MENILLEMQRRKTFEDSPAIGWFFMAQPLPFFILEFMLRNYFENKNALMVIPLIQLLFSARSAATNSQHPKKIAHLNDFADS